MYDNLIDSKEYSNEKKEKKVLINMFVRCTT